MYKNCGKKNVEETVKKHPWLRDFQVYLLMKELSNLLANIPNGCDTTKFKDMQKFLRFIEVWQIDLIQIDETRKSKEQKEKEEREQKRRNESILFQPGTFSG